MFSCKYKYIYFQYLTLLRGALTMISDETREKWVHLRDEGYTIASIAEKTNSRPAIVRRYLIKTLGETFYDFNPDVKGMPDMKIQERLYQLFMEYLTDHFPKYEVPFAKQRYVEIDKRLLKKVVGVEIKATYYDTVVKAIWKYKTYHKNVDKLYIIVVSRRLTGEKIKSLNKDKTKPRNVKVIDYRDTDLLGRFRKKLLELGRPGMVRKSKI